MVRWFRRLEGVRAFQDFKLLETLGGRGCFSHSVLRYSRFVCKWRPIELESRIADSFRDIIPSHTRSPRLVRESIDSITIRLGSARVVPGLHCKTYVAGFSKSLTQDKLRAEEDPINICRIMKVAQKSPLSGHRISSRNYYSSALRWIIWSRFWRPFNGSHLIMANFSMTTWRDTRRCVKLFRQKTYNVNSFSRETESKTWLKDSST